MSPGAYTNSLDPFFDIESEEFREQFKNATPPELVSPAVAYLCHEECEVTGGLFDVSAGQITSTSVTVNAGFYDPELTIEDVRDNLETILRRSNDDVLITNPRDPIGTINEQASMISLKPYQARF
jgi:hypothetical protein